MSQQQFRFSPSVIVYPLVLLFVIWLSFWYQIRVDYGIKSYGIRPQKLEGLLGVVTSPFLHGDIDHIFNNSVPLLVLSIALFYFYNKIAWRIIILGILFTGILTWTIAKSGNHIGASGLVYVLVSFIFFKGIFAKHYRLIALSLIVVFLYGSMIWYVFPIKEGMSWEGHLSGLITGLLFAIVFRKQVAKPERYIWESPDYDEEDDLFMQHFDQHGNFIEQIEDKDHEIERTKESEPATKINYIFKKDED